jgi:hypothetical protein
MPKITLSRVSGGGSTRKRCAFSLSNQKHGSKNWSMRHGPRGGWVIEIANHRVIIGDVVGVPDGI